MRLWPEDTDIFKWLTHPTIHVLIVAGSSKDKYNKTFFGVSTYTLRSVETLNNCQNCYYATYVSESQRETFFHNLPLDEINAAVSFERLEISSKEKNAWNILQRKRFLEDNLNFHRPKIG